MHTRPGENFRRLKFHNSFRAWFKNSNFSRFYVVESKVKISSYFSGVMGDLVEFRS